MARNGARLTLRIKVNARKVALRSIIKINAHRVTLNSELNQWVSLR